MGHTASMTANRVTICLTNRQRTFLLDGVRRNQIGLSEYIRRLLDQLVEDGCRRDEPPNGRR